MLGFGFATPYLGDIAKAERVLAFMPAGQGVIDWPTAHGSATALVAEDSLPLPDCVIDLVILVHALEMSDGAQRPDDGAAAGADQRRAADRGRAQPPGAVGELRPFALRLRPPLLA